MRRRYLLAGLLAAAMATAWSTAGASGLQVAPVGLEFAPSSPAQGLWLTNTGTDTLHAQVRVFHWTQSAGKNELTPTQALVASPPMLTLAPGARQLVRVIRLGASSANGEDAFRLLVDELPQATPQKQTGVQYVLRYSIPVFVEPSDTSPDATSVAASLRFALVRAGGSVELQVRNTGAAHAQLSDVEILPPGSSKPAAVSPGLLGYVLPGMTMRWPLKVQSAQLPSGTQLKATINGTPVDQPLQADGLPR